MCKTHGTRASATHHSAPTDRSATRQTGRYTGGTCLWRSRARMSKRTQQPQAQSEQSSVPSASASTKFMWTRRRQQPSISAPAPPQQPTPSACVVMHSQIPGTATESCIACRRWSLSTTKTCATKTGARHHEFAQWGGRVAHALCRRRRCGGVQTGVVCHARARAASQNDIKSNAFVWYSRQSRRQLRAGTS